MTDKSSTIDTSESERRFDELRNKLRPTHIDIILQHISDVEGKKISLSDREPEVLSGGVKRSTYKFATDHGSYVVSISTPRASISQEAHDLQAYLYEKGAPVAKLLGNVGNLPSGHQFQVAEFIAGKSGALTRFTCEEMEAYGHALAKIHHLTEDFFRRRHIEPTHAREDWKYAGELLGLANDVETQAIIRSLRDDTAISESMLHAINDLREQAYNLPDKKLKSGLAHGDTNLGNMIVAENGQVTIIDLEMCGKGMPLRDLVIPVLWGCFSRDENKAIRIDEQKVGAFFKGYDDERIKKDIKPLSMEEKRNVLELIKIEVKSFFNMSPKKWGTPQDYWELGKEVCSWVDRIAHSYISPAITEKPRC